MEEQNTYTLNIRARNLSYFPDGYKKDAIELHRHHFDNFYQSFAFLMSLDEKYFCEHLAVRDHRGIALESADLNFSKSPKTDEPTVLTAMRGGDSPLINEPPGLYYIMWNGVGAFSRDFEISLEAFQLYDPLRMLLPVAHFDTHKNEVNMDPAYERLKHTFLQLYLNKKKTCVSTLSIANNMDLPGEQNYSGRIVDVWHFDTIKDALTAFIRVDMQMLDLGYCSIMGENRYYEGIKLYEERGDELLSLTTNIYDAEAIPEKAKGIYLHFNQNTALGQFIRQYKLTRGNRSYLLAAGYENGYHFSGVTDDWLRLKSTLSQFNEAGALNKRRSSPSVLTEQKKTIRIKQ